MGVLFWDCPMGTLFALLFNLVVVTHGNGFRPVVRFPEGPSNITARQTEERPDMGYPQRPSYIEGPSSPENPEGHKGMEASIEVDTSNLVLRCKVVEPYEHIVWRRYRCPEEYMYSYGEVVAVGASVEDEVYDVRLTGHQGVVWSALYLRQPLRKGGMFVCEAWPHYRARIFGRLDEHQYRPDKAATDLFVIGGRDLVEECYQRPFAGNRRPRNNSLPPSLAFQDGFHSPNPSHNGPKSDKLKK